MPFLSGKKGRQGVDNGKGKRLTPKMHEFIDLYMIHKNATKAVELSSYKTRNPTTIGVMLLQHPLVVEEIKRRHDIRSDKAEVTAEFLIQKLLVIINDDETKTTDTLRAIELAGKSIALWKDRQEISGPDGGAIETEQRVKESAADFTNKLSVLVKRNATDNVVPFSQSGGSASPINGRI